MTPREILTAGPVVPVIAIDNPQTAVGLAQALLDGGIRVLEITLRTPAAVEAIRRIYLEGAGFSEIAPNFLPMLLVAAVTLPLAGWLFRHKTT